MIVVDAYGRRHQVPDSWDQDFEIELPWLKPWGNSRMHWKTESGRKAKQKHLTMLQLQARGVRPELPVTIVLQRVTNRGTLDDDNVPDAMKYIRDTIARWMGLNSDRKPGLRWLYGQQRTARKGFKGVRITIIKPEESEEP